MKKINIVKENRDFKRIMDLVKPIKNNCYTVFVEKNNNLNNYKFGISVSKKLGNAVTRNKLKRQIKSIIDKKNYQKNFNCIIILKRGILEKNYQEKELLLMEIFNKINIIKGEENER